MKNYTDVINDINAGTTADALSLILREAASRVLENAKAALDMPVYAGEYDAR